MTLSPKARDRIYSLIGLAMGVSAAILSDHIGGIVRALQQVAQQYLASLVFQSLFIVMIGAIAAALFKLRTRRLRLYANLEILFGLFASVYAANELYAALTPESRTKGLFATVAGIYIIIRGLDNRQKSYPPSVAVEGAG